MFRGLLLKSAVLIAAFLILPSVVLAKSRMVTTPSGLKYQDTKVGHGPAVKTGQTVTIFYTGWLMDGRVFYSNKEINKPLTFPLGGHQVIPGWDEGIVGMKVGGVRKLTVPPHLGYGVVKVGSIIPPNVTLIFEIQLLEIKK